MLTLLITWESRLRSQRVSFEYRAAGRRFGRAAFDPYLLRTDGEYWFVTGYCHRRKTVTAYLLETIRAVRLEDHYFYRPDDWESKSRES